jgi:hypothetical protein
MLRAMAEFDPDEIVIVAAGGAKPRAKPRKRS